MKTDDVQKLAELARLHITDEQCNEYLEDFNSILGYIDAINEVQPKATEALMVLKNIVREDEDSYQPGEFSEAILANAPEHENQFIKVKKIL